jgi:hypothetical protein
VFLVAGLHSKKFFNGNLRTLAAREVLLPSASSKSLPPLRNDIFYVDNSNGLMKSH